MNGTLLIWLGLMVVAMAVGAQGEQGPRNGVAPSIYTRDNLVAWCIVPFDAKKRGPEERARMLERLGIKALAYDWRDEHVATFEDEIEATKRLGIEFFATWKSHPKMLRLFRRHQMAPQIWLVVPKHFKGTETERMQAAVKWLLPHVKSAREQGCQ